jgi:hypothetical protein
MPTYELRADDGTVLERTVTLPPDRDGSGYDKQMAALAEVEDIPWHLVDEHQAAAVEPTPAAYSAAVAATNTAAVPPAVPDDLKTEEV